MSSPQLSLLDSIQVQSSSPQNPVLRRLRPPRVSDVPLVTTTILLVGFGVLILYSTTGVLAQERFGDSLYYLKRQLVAVVLGLAGMLLVSRIRMETLKSFSPLCLPLGVILLLMTLIPGVGDSAGGASRWITLFGQRFQPGEFVKLLFIFFMAGYFARHEEKLDSFSQGVCKPLLLVGLIGVLYLSQPDFGSTALVALVTLTMAFTAGVRIRYILLSFLFAAASLAVLVMISPYRMKRILSFLEPTADASGKGYQLLQSLIAVGTGQFTGVGLGEGQQKLFFLPAAHTDFIFAVVAEELGFLGAIFLLALFGVFLWRGLRIAWKVRTDVFSYTLAVGLTMLIVLPALLNMGVVLGLLPTKGMVLPLVSYGGTNIIVSLVGIGFLLTLGRGVPVSPR